MENITQTFVFSFLIAGVVVSLIVWSLGMDQFIQDKAESSNLHVQIFSSEAGYGYKILSEEKILIQQDYIPVLENKQPFCNWEQAHRVAIFVQQKLQNGLSPAISLSELKELNIEFNCIK